MPSKSTNFRDEIYRKITDIAEQEGKSFSHVANRLADHGLVKEGHCDERVMLDG